MKDDIADLVEVGELDPGDGGAFMTKLNVAEKKISEGKQTPAINALGAFVNQVEALVNSERLAPIEGQPPIEGQAPIEAANGLMAA